jgi:hypothetical protein
MSLQRPRTLLLIVAILPGGGGFGYWILLSPGRTWVRWARAAYPSNVTMITFGPYSGAKDLE